MAVALATLLGACEDASKEQAAAPPPPAEVEVAEVKQETVPVIMEFAGTVQSIRAVDIIPRVSGYIEKRQFQEGTYVEEGSPLYLIDPRPFQARLDAVQAQLQKDEANVKFWASEADRATRLAEQAAGSVEDKERAISQRDGAIADVAQDKSDIANAQLDLDYSHITAPFAGRIENTRVYKGDVVTRQKDVLTTLVQIDPIHVIFNVSRRQVAVVQSLKKQGLSPETIEEIKATVRLPDGSAYDHEGHLDFVSNQVDPSTDTLTARAVFPNERAKDKTGVVLLPGQYVPLSVTVGKQPDAVLIPESALVQSQVGTHVFVVDKDNKVDARPVEVDRSYQQQWVIKKGLKKGEQVIVEGLQKLRSGAVVKVTPADAKKSQG
jgi:membrane fusion protein (multidrug efflux system)